MRFTLYTKPCCPLCDEALAVIERVRRKTPFALDVVNIESDPELKERYQHLIPVLACDGEELAYGKVSEHRLRQILQRGEAGAAPLLPERYRRFLARLAEILQQRQRTP